MRFGYVLHLRSMDNYLVGLEASIVSEAFIYIHSLCVGAVKTLASVRMCAHSHVPSLQKTTISIKYPMSLSILMSLLVRYA